MLIKYRLRDGRIVEAERECKCLPEIHSFEEPHWLYFDRMWHEKNRRLLPDGDSDGLSKLLSYMAFYKEESMRLAWKESEMRKRDIVEVIRTEEIKIS